MDVKLFDSELKIMSVLWREGDCTAKHISDVMKEETGWNINTTYTLIKRCIKKGAFPLCNHFSKNAVEERIIAIMKTRKVTVGILLVSAAIVIIVTALFATSAGKQEEQAESVKKQYLSGWRCADSSGERWNRVG